MDNWHYPFDFSDKAEPRLKGELRLNSPQNYAGKSGDLWQTRAGRVLLEEGPGLDIVLYHNLWTEAIFYTSKIQPVASEKLLLGLRDGQEDVEIPGQLILGSRRENTVTRAVKAMMEAPLWQQFLGHRTADQVISFPVMREGLKYGITHGLITGHEKIVDEVLLDAHHIDDPSVAGYGRRTEISVFKDKDLSEAQREMMKVAVIGDSIASGTVMISVIEAILERYPNLEQIEIVAPLAALRGLARTALYMNTSVPVRVHVFESLLNALPPDFYWSAHFAQPEFHFEPSLEQRYRDWWGIDDNGAIIADTACAGYGWSESFFNPRKHLQMIHEQLGSRHNLTLADLLRRNSSLELPLSP